MPPNEKRSIFELSMVIRCLCETACNRDPTVQRVVAACIARLLEAQNDDGGWDSSIWVPEGVTARRDGLGSIILEVS